MLVVLFVLGCNPIHHQPATALVEESQPVVEVETQPRGPDVVEIAESGIPDHVAHKVDATLADNLARDPKGPYGVFVDFKYEHHSLEELIAMGLIPNGSMAAGHLSREVLFTLVECDCVIALSGFGPSYGLRSSGQ